MNKYKQHLSEMKQYLNRDTRGLALLDAIARDITDQRKELAALRQSEADAVASARHAKQELINVQNEKAEIEKMLEKEGAKRRAAENATARCLERLAKLEPKAKEGYSSPAGGDDGVDGQAIRQVKRLFKDVRMRFKVAPRTDGIKNRFVLEDLVKGYSGDEFMDIGKLLAVMALHNFPVLLYANRTIAEMNGWKEKDTARFVRWFSPNMTTDALREKIYGPTNCRFATERSLSGNAYIDRTKNRETASPM